MNLIKMLLHSNIFIQKFEVSVMFISLLLFHALQYIDVAIIQISLTITV